MAVIVLRAAATAAARRSCSARRLSAMRCARAIESRRAASMLSVFGPDGGACCVVGWVCGCGLLPPQAATAAAIRITPEGTRPDKRVIACSPKKRRKDGNQHSWRQRAGPGRETCLAAECELPHAARFHIQHPQFACPRAQRGKHDVAAVRGVRRIFVAPLARELFDAAIAKADGFNLKNPADPRTEGNRAAIGRPVGTLA